MAKLLWQGIAKWRMWLFTFSCGMVLHSSHHNKGEAMYPTRKPIPARHTNALAMQARSAVQRLAEAKEPRVEAVRTLFDFVNMGETFITHNGGVWKGCDLKPTPLEDDDGLIKTGIQTLGAMWNEGLRTKQPMRLDEKSAQELLDLIDCVEEIMLFLPHSEVHKCMNITARRIKLVLAGRVGENDIVIKAGENT